MPLFLSIFIVFMFFMTASAQNPLTSQFFDEGMKAAQKEQYEKALENYQKALFYTKYDQASDNFLAKIHFNIGVCQYQSKRPKDAVAEFKKAVKLSKSTYQKAFYALGMAQIDLKNSEEAVSAFEQAVKLKENDGEAWFDLAVALIAEKDFAAAEKALNKSIKYKSVAAPRAHNNLGVVFALKGDLDNAEKEFNTALRESNGELIEAHENLQSCKTHRQKFNKTSVANLQISNRTEARKQI
jgi:tetratricopeptide (TPR) repeat protein